MKPQYLLLPLLLILFSTVPAALVYSDYAEMLLTSIDNGMDWKDRGDADGPALVASDFGGEKIGARAIDINLPDGLTGQSPDNNRGEQTSLLLELLDEMVSNSYGLVRDADGPFNHGDAGAIVVSIEFYDESRFYREYLIWDGDRLLNLTLWCQAGQVEGLSGILDDILGGFRWM
ncbi:hypothetical protein K8R78_03045 [bacterium]|nr:hypothetical protein [bacterium]